MIPLPRPALPFGACVYCAGDDEHAPHCSDVAGKPKVRVASFKMTRATKVFNEGQRVWVQQGCGSMAAQVTGKFRNRYRWVSSWVNWNHKCDVPPTWQYFEVDAKFARDRGLLPCPLHEAIAARKRCEEVFGATVADRIWGERHAHGGGPRVVPTTEAKP